MACLVSNVAIEVFEWFLIVWGLVTFHVPFSRMFWLLTSLCSVGPFRHRNYNSGLKMSIRAYLYVPKGMCEMCDITRYQGETKGLLFSSICVNIVLFSTHKGVMTFNDVREECLECHMTSNDVREECLECHMTSHDIKGECHFPMMTGRCVNKPDQTEPVGCYENKFILNFAKCMYIYCCSLCCKRRRTLIK